MLTEIEDVAVRCVVAALVVTLAVVVAFVFEVGG